MLKHGKISSSDQEHQQMVDPFVRLLTDCLKSKYNKVWTGTISRPYLQIHNPYTRCCRQIGAIVLWISFFSTDQFCFLCIQVVTISLRCVSWLVKFPLPSLNHCVPTMGKLLFNLLKNYAKAGAKVGENFEMVLSAFKVKNHPC